MKEKLDNRIPRSNKLIMPTFIALKELGGSGTNKEILDKIIKNLNIPDDIVDILHKGSTTRTALSYEASWARTYLSKSGVIKNSERSVWSINPDFINVDFLDVKQILINKSTESKPKNSLHSKYDKSKNIELYNNKIVNFPQDSFNWQEQLSEILKNMDPYGFERLTQRILRECGFTQVEITKKSNDGGIDGIGKLKINGIFSFNVAFQCKRYNGVVSSSVIRDFRGSLTTDIEKGVVITTGTFSKSAQKEASKPGKKQIDLIDNEELINKIVEYKIGVQPVTIYEIDESFFKNL